jgi:hypothetical protein
MENTNRREVCLRIRKVVKSAGVMSGTASTMPDKKKTLPQ